MLCKHEKVGVEISVGHVIHLHMGHIIPMNG